MERNIRKKRTMTAAGLTAAILIMCVFVSGYSAEINHGLSENLIRLHVVANSDSREDQELKMEVRDAVINYLDDMLKDSDSLEQSLGIIHENMEQIRLIVLQKVREHGFDYPVEALTGNYPFPTKQYGDVVLPAGYYQSLKIVIGKGEGENWWCVLFPPLCFVDATHGTIPDYVKEDLKASLSEEDYNMIISAESEKDIPIRIKFRIVEFFQGSKIRVAGMFNRLFRSGRQ